VAQRSRADHRRDTTGGARGRRPVAARVEPSRSLSGPTASPQPVAEAATSDTESPELEALVVSHWFESGAAGGPPYNALVRLTGRRRDVQGRPMGADSFTVTESVRGVVPGSGRVSTTSWVYNLNPGAWDVTAELLGPERARAATRDLHLPRASWSWRSRSLRPTEPAPIRTRWAPLAPLAPTPAVLPGSFTVLASIAILTAILSQRIFLGHLGIDSGAAMRASILGLVTGVVGAKAWYMALKGPSRQSLREGWSVDGFLVVGPVVAALAVIVQGVAIGSYLDSVAPGIFLAVAIGRVGCFLTGCCAGRPTAGWGLWSSDRRVGSRRIPAQLLESAVGIFLAALSAILAVNDVTHRSGIAFAVAGLIYVTARQVLLRLRAEARPFSWRRASGGAVAGT
jgi:phosphatidylglycerol---prolipoprotein diacylglyceryl transferase